MYRYNAKVSFIALFTLICSSLSYSQNLSEMTEEYNSLIEKKKYEKANELTDQMLSKYPAFPRVYIRKAESLISLGHFDESFQILDLAINYFPDTLYLYYAAAGLHSDLRNVERSVEYFDDALEICSTAVDSSNVLCYRAGAYNLLRDFDKSESDLNKSLILNPKNIEALNNLGNVYLERGDLDKSMGYLISILEVDSTHSYAIRNMGFVLQQMEKHEKALVYFDKGISLDPKAAYAHCNRAFSKMKIGDLKGAMSDVDKSIELLYTNPWAYKVKGLIYIEKNKFDKACEQFYIAKDLKYSQAYGDEVDELIKGFCND